MKTVKCWGADCQDVAVAITSDRMLLCGLCHMAHGPQAGDQFVSPIKIIGTVTGVSAEVEEDGRSQ
jgi:hypothetical protein